MLVSFGFHLKPNLHIVFNFYSFALSTVTPMWIISAGQAERSDVVAGRHMKTSNLPAGSWVMIS